MTEAKEMTANEDLDQRCKDHGFEVWRAKRGLRIVDRDGALLVGGDTITTTREALCFMHGFGTGYLYSGHGPS